MENNNILISKTIVTRENIIFSKDYAESIIADLFPVVTIREQERNNLQVVSPDITRQLKTFFFLPASTALSKKVLENIQQAGYDGLEFAPSQLKNENSFGNLLKHYDFDTIAQVNTSGDTVNEHFESFRNLIQKSLPFNPIMINSFSGKDRWGMDEKNDFLIRALSYEASIGIPVAHQIQRGRITYNPWDTKDFLLNFETLKLACDFSQWVCVCDSLLYDEDDIIRLCAQRCIHLHGKIAFGKRSHPRQHAAYIQACEHWWDIIWEAQKKNNIKISTLTPLPHLSTNLPMQQQHTSNMGLWKMCNWIKDRQQRRFNQC